MVMLYLVVCYTPDDLTGIDNESVLAIVDDDGIQLAIERLHRREWVGDANGLSWGNERIEFVPVVVNDLRSV